ncbi:MAG: AAA family ATPase [Candidatus Cloacimonetes bacterium]|jgi:general secretion pathway protein A|nr:AAA family ATPase [Candidatus Cloacimonadota bacterium]MBT4332622.1 AAA family ATPase [Candidatus Cloacimonadota bacterium]MBT4575008.1 AAA family ATPase [Candidatus Cloacimonadota bacterium]MBT5420491.1 AAA family ATPase [Candidatus Cloacimonadota bacterium]
MESYQYWMLNNYAFEENATSEYFYNSKIHREALDRLSYIIESNNMGIGLLTGEIGAGKTMTRNVLINKVINNSFDYEFAVMDTSNFTFVDILMDTISQICNIDYTDLPRNKYRLYKIFRDYINSKMLSSNKKIVIILDEAQKISATVLDSLKDLTNIVHNNSSVITIILVGQPELTSKLKKLPQIDQRISLKYHLNYLSLDDTKEYIRFRQFASGSQKDLFTEEAMRMIHSQTHGIPREINRACRIALDYGYSEELEIITDKEMKMILRDFA